MVNRALLVLLFAIMGLSGCGGTDSNHQAAQVSVVSASASSDDPYGALVQQLYVAYFGRPSDPGGFSNFKSQLTTLGAPTTIQELSDSYNRDTRLKTLIDSFGQSSESAALYGVGNTSAFVTAIFQNILNRSPLSGGLNYWVDAIDNKGLSRANASLSIMAGALANTTPQGLQDAQLIHNRISTSTTFTSSLVSAEEIAGYSGRTAASEVRDMLKSITASTDLSTVQSTVDSVVSTLITQSTAEGFWSGKLNDTYDVDLAILEDGSTWGYYFSHDILYGVVLGQTTSSGTTMSGGGFSFDVGSHTAFQGSFSGSFLKKTSMSLTMNDGSKLVASYKSDYDRAALLSNLAGTYNGFAVTAEGTSTNVSVIIGADGKISAPSPFCAAAGQATPRASGKNIFNVAVTFSGTSCDLGNGATASGIAYYDSSSREVTVMAVNGSKTDGFVYFGSKP